LQSLFQHRLSLFSRSRERFTAHSRYYHRYFEELSVRSPHRRDRVLSRTHGKGRGCRRGYFHNFQRRDCDHNGDRLRYNLQRHLHYVLSNVSTPLHMVELRDVHMRFEEKKVLDGVSLKVEPQERLVIMGHSGSGKTTLL